jgi:hypothetical protein
MRWLQYTILVVLLSSLGALSGQNLYTATIINSATNSPMKDCPIQLEGVKGIYSTDSLGRFEVNRPDTGAINLTVLGLNCHVGISIPKPNTHFAPVVVFCPPYELATVPIEYLDGLVIMKKAAAQLPNLYADSAYIAFGFYRNYKKINNVFREITEADIASVMRITENENKLYCEEAFGIQNIRRTRYTIAIDQYYDKALKDLFVQNPVYHHDFSLLTPYFLRHGDFYIDSASTDSTWVISYTLRGITGENHGVDNYSPEAFFGEADESGYYVIDKENYAILKIVRETKRDPKYEYPGYNNFLLPDLKYTGEFEEGYLEINYTLFEGKYYVKNIFHAHTNSFTHVATNQEVYRITDYSEFTCDSIGFYIDDNLMQDLKTYENNELVKYQYEPSLWELRPPFFFVKRDTVMSDLQKRGDLTELFVAGGK